LILSRILWLQGFPDQGLRLAERNVEDARAIDLAVGVCYALETASLVSIWSSDLAATERHVTALLDYSARHALAVWHRPARCYDGVRLIQRGDVGQGLELLSTALDELRRTSLLPYHPVMLGNARARPGRGGARSLRHSRRLTRRSPNPNVTRSDGGSPSCCASKPSSSCWRRTQTPR
jgi:hypothetical protein